jgi:hypothetical protein
MNQASQPARALVGAGEQHPGHLNAQGFGGLGLHRQVAGLLSLEDAIDVAGRLPVLVDIISPIGDQATGDDEGTFWANCRQLMSNRQRGYHLAMMQRRRAPCHDQRRPRQALRSSEAQRDPVVGRISLFGRLHSGVGWNLGLPVLLQTLWRRFGWYQEVEPVVVLTTGWFHRLPAQFHPIPA